MTVGPGSRSVRLLASRQADFHHALGHYHGSVACSPNPPVYDKGTGSRTWCRSPYFIPSSTHKTPRLNEVAGFSGYQRRDISIDYLTVLSRPGNDLLSQVLRLSTIGAEAFNGRVRDGIGFWALRNCHQVGKEQLSEFWFLVLSQVPMQ